MYLRARELVYTPQADPDFPDGQPDVSKGSAAFAEYRNRREARALCEGIYRPLQHVDKWRVTQGRSFYPMSKNKLKSLIANKEGKVKDYAPCTFYWLLVVVDAMDPAQEQEIRIDDFTEIHSTVFENVVVYKPLFRHIRETNANNWVTRMGQALPENPSENRENRSLLARSAE